MAQYLATTTTLGRMKAMIKGQVGAVTDQESGILDIEMADLIHQAILNVRSLLGGLVDNFYETQETLGSITITSGEGSVTVATNQIANINKVRLADATIKRIVIKDVAAYNTIKSLYTSAEIGTTNAVVAFISTITTNVPTLKAFFYTGAAGPLTTVLIIYPRFPYKVTTDADTLDVPETYVPLCRDIASLYVAKRLAKQPSQEVVASIAAAINPIVETLGIHISPNSTQ